MDETDYRHIEPWMHSVMEKYWAGQTWNQAISDTPPEKFTNPKMHGPRSIGKILIPENCSTCQGAIMGHFASRLELAEGLKWNRCSLCCMQTQALRNALQLFSMFSLSLN